MAVEAGRVFVPVVLDTRGVAAQAAATGAVAARTLSTRLSAGLKTAGKGLTAGVTAPIIAIGAVAFNAAADYQKAMATIRTGTGATGEALSALGDTFRKVNKEVPNATGDVASAIADLNTRTGATGKTLEDLSTQMLNLARVSGEDVSSLVASTTRVFGDWGVATEDQSETLDRLFKVSQNTGIGVGQLADEVVRVGAPLRQMGFSFEESAAMIGKFEKEGVNGQLVMGSLRIALGKLAKSGKEPVAAFREQVKAIQEAGDAGEANGLALELFGARAGPDMAAAIREGRFDIDQLMKQLDKSPETINKAAKASLTFNERLTLLRKGVSDSLIPVGEQLMTMFEAMIPQFQAAGEWLARMGEKFAALSPSTRRLVIISGLLLAALGPTLIVLGAIVGAAGTLISAGMAVVRVLRIWTAVQWLLNAALAANPIGLVIAALAALVVGLVVAYKRSETFRKIVDGAWQAVQRTVRTAMTAIQREFGYWKTAFVNGMAVAKVLRDRVRDHFTAIATSIRDKINAAKTTLGNALDAIRTKWNNVWGGIRDGMSGLWTGIQTAIRNGINGAIGLLNKFIDAANRILDKLPGDFKIPTIATLSAPAGAAPRGATVAGARGGRERGGWSDGPFQKRGATDKIPMWLAPDEFVWSADAAKRFGRERLERLHNRFRGGQDRDLAVEAEQGAAPAATPGRGSGWMKELIYAGSPWWMLGGRKVNSYGGGLFNAHKNHVHVAGLAWQTLGAMMRQSGIPHRLTSGYRPGGATYHGRGLAADFAGPVPSATPTGAMDRIFNFWAGQVGMPGSATGGGGGLGTWLADRIASLTERASGPLMSGLDRVLPGGMVGDLVRGSARKMVDALLEKLQGESGTVSGGGNTANMTLGRQMAAEYGWAGGQWDALRELWTRESGWNHLAQNPTSSAYGIAQFLDSTWGGVGARKTSDPGGQIAAGLRYIAQRYGTPSGAMSFWQGHKWYDQGGWLQKGVTVAHHNKSTPDLITPVDAMRDVFRDELRRQGREINVNVGQVNEPVDVDMIISKLAFSRL